MELESAPAEALPPSREYIPRLGAGCVVMLGLILLVGGAGILFRPGVSLAEPFVILAIGMGLIVAGVFSSRYIADFERRRRVLFEEKTVLAVAIRSHGALTLAQIAFATPLSIQEVEHVMARLCRERIAEMEIDPDGTIRYRFRGLDEYQ